MRSQRSIPATLLFWERKHPMVFPSLTPAEVHSFHPQTCAVSSSLLKGACGFKHEISTNKCFLHALRCGFAVDSYALIASLPCNCLPQVSAPIAQSTRTHNKHFMLYNHAQVAHIQLTLTCTSPLFKHRDTDCSVINS